MSEEQTINEPKILLPQDEAALDQFVESIATEFNVPTGDDTYDAIATMILHLPQTSAFVPRSYFGNSVRKSLANKAAYNRLRQLAEKRKAEEEKAELSLVPKEPDAANEQPLQNA